MLDRGSASTSGTISRAEALDDLDALMRTLQHVHPDPYRFRSREVVQDVRRRLVDNMPASLGRNDLCLRLSELLASLDDGHTSMACDRLVLDDWQRAAKASPPRTQRLRMFPPYMRLDDQQHLIVGWPNDAPGVERGDRLLRVNGHEVDELLAAWTREWSHDTAAGRLAALASGFRVKLALHGIDAPYHVIVAAPGGLSRDVTIQGEPVNYLWQERPKPPPTPVRSSAVGGRPMADGASVVAKSVELKTSFFNYRLLEPGIAYMDFFTLLGGAFPGRSFRKAVDEMFRRIASDRPRTLIIDIRENGGGDDWIATELFRHITEKPFRLLASTQVKRSEEARAVGTSMIRIPFRWFQLQYLFAEGRQYYRGEVGSLAPPLERPVQRHERAEPFFAGPVCMLTGPYTFSAAVEFAEAAKTYGLATIVGEATGGQPNSFGNPMVFPLPHGGLAATIATARSVRANGNTTDFNSVIPDVNVRTSAEDIQRGRDPGLERAKNCPPRSQP